MPRELLTIQVGQCGNQVGTKFWELALNEHAKHAKNDVYDDSLSSFFRNVDIRNGVLQELPYDGGKSKIQSLKARSIVVDMEQGVINQMMKSEIGEIFDERLFINDVSGAGNNWAHGFGEYGPKYEAEIFEKIRKGVEACDSLQCFLVFHSLGGGTGSGVGSYIVESLADYYPNIFRFTASIFPSKEDMVVTSPYNSILSLNKLIKFADCVLPIENQALMNICEAVDRAQGKSPSEKTGEQLIAKSDQPVPVKGSKITELGEEKKKEKPYDRMNNIVAHLLSSLTCSMRFEGVLNVDLNEITMNLVPFPRMHFLGSSLAPLYTVAGLKQLPRSLDQSFKDCLHSDYQLICSNPLAHKYIAMGLMVRGDVAFSDVNRNIKKLKEQVQMIYWNQEGFKYGICNVPPVGQPYSLLCLSNNTCIRNSFQDLGDRFNKLYKRKVFTHHYADFVDLSIFEEAIGETNTLISEYKDLEGAEEPKKLPKLYPII